MDPKTLEKIGKNLDAISNAAWWLPIVIYAVCALWVLSAWWS